MTPTNDSKIAEEMAKVLEGFSCGTGNLNAFGYEKGFREITDKYNRKRRLKRLEKQIKKGKLTKSHINNRGYNKYLKMEGDVSTKIDYEKFDKDKSCNGLILYVTNVQIKNNQIVDCYQTYDILKEHLICQKQI